MQANNSLVKQASKQTFSNFLMGDAIKRKINEVVGGANGQRFITAILSAVSTNPALQDCEHSSIISAAFLGESLKLSPSPQLGQYYLVPFKDKKRGCTIAQFQLGYKGYIQLAIRSGQYKKLNVLAIKEGELINYNPLTGDLEINLIEDEEIRENTPTTGYYAMFEYLNGFTKSMYWSKQKMLSHADKYSMAFKKEMYDKLQAGQIPEQDMWKYSSFWYKDFDGMALKTMLRQLISKWGIMSIDLQNAIEKDMAEIKEDGTYNYIENIPDEDVNISDESNFDDNYVPTTEEAAQTENTKDDNQQNDMANEFFNN